MMSEALDECITSKTCANIAEGTDSTVSTRAQADQRRDLS